MMQKQSVCLNSRSFAEKKGTSSASVAAFLVHRKYIVSGVMVVFAVMVWFVQVSCVVGGECKFDVDCLDDQICLNTVCTKYSEDGGTKKQGCRYDADCPSDQLCYLGRCQSTATLFENVGGETWYAEQQTTIPDQVADVSRPETTPTEQTIQQDNVVKDAPPVSAPGLPPGVHGFSGGSLFSVSSPSKHVAIIGPTTPLVPSATVMRSTNYSMRPGIVATTLW